MKKFQDKNGGDWKIELTIGLVQRVKNESEGRFNLYEPGGKVGDVPLQQLLYDEPGDFWELLWYLVEPQATAKEIDASQFGELLAAECLISAQTAFFSEWRDFFQSLQRPDKAAALEKLVKFQIKARQLVELKLQDPRINELEKKTEERMQSTLNSAFSALLDSSESTPTRGPGGN